MANSVTARFNDDCKVFVSMSDDTTVEKAVIIDAEGNETDIGGGGGSSDFSTATVVFINNSSNTEFIINAPFIYDDNLNCNIYAEDMSVDFPYEIVLYKELLSFRIPDDSHIVFESATGDITINDLKNRATVTGAGTITITDAES